MKKELKKVATLGLVLGSVIGAAQINPVSAFDGNLLNENDLSSKIEFDNNSTTEEMEAYKANIVNNPNYSTTTSVRVEEYNSDISMVIETIEYKPNTKAIANGTKFGSYSSIKFYDKELWRYAGTVGVDVQGQKVNSTTAKINYIRYSNSDFKFSGDGGYKSQINSQGNPGYGTVYVSFRYYGTDGQFYSDSRLIPVQAYPTGTIKIN